MRSVASLAGNRALKAVCEGRIGRAEAQIVGYLLQQGVSTVRLGGYQVDLSEAGELELTLLPSVDGRQPPLPELENVMRSRPEDVLTSEVVLYQKRP